MNHMTHSHTGPICILLHGFPNDRRLWSFQIPVLQSHFAVISVDLVDRGSREMIDESELNFEMILNQLNQLIRTFQTEYPQRKIYLVAHDVGCFFADELSRCNREIAGQILINGKNFRNYLQDTQQAAQWLRSTYVWALQLPGVPKVAYRYFGHWLAGWVYRFARISKASSESLRAISCFNWLNIYRTLLYAGRLRLRKASNRCAAPTTLVQSIADPFLAPTDSDRAREFYGLTTQVHSIRASHWAPFTHPNLVNGIVLKQLASWESGL